jgi:hypothetical protein
MFRAAVASAYPNGPRSSKVFGYLLTTCTRSQESIHPADVTVVFIQRHHAAQSQGVPVFVQDPADLVLNLPAPTLSITHDAFGRLSQMSLSEGNTRP